MPLFTITFFLIYTLGFLPNMDSSRISLCVCCCSVTKSLWPHGLQHTSLSCPPPSPRVCSNSHSLSQWFNLAISSSAVLFSFWLQSFPVSESFRMSQLFTSGGQSTGASASASVLPMNIQGWFPLGVTGLNSLLSKRLSRVCSSTISSSVLSLLYCPTVTSIYDCWKH